MKYPRADKVVVMVKVVANIPLPVLSVITNRQECTN